MSKPLLSTATVSKGTERRVMDQPLLRVKEAAQLLHVSKWTIYRWVDEGRLDATKIGGGSLRIFRRSVMALVEGNRIDSRPTESVPQLKMVPLTGRRSLKR
ncbi:DNA-binding protein [Nitrospira defluvii]|uniref:DNA-binding protein n=2 Tax=Nitrospira defluvii TaxID=330214 RepID=A0ABN7KLL3_9BACT|nr:DNA-binding protein [Nitrospira defluvii]